MSDRLSINQLAQLTEVLHKGAREASQALASWLECPSLVEIDSVEQLQLEKVLETISPAGDVSCFATLEISGWLQGMLILIFDDSSGLSLTDLILNRPIGTSTEWGEIEKSSALETMNIIGSVYLNSLASHYSNVAETTVELLPSPPSFCREFAESVLETAFVGQAMISDWVVVAKTRFTVRGEALDWTLLFVPDGDSMRLLSGLTE